METIIATLQSNSTTGRALRTVASVDGNTPIGYAPPVEVISGVEKIVGTQNGQFGTDSLVGDIWWRVIGVKVRGDDLNTYDGWMAEKHKGEQLLNVTFLGDPTPPPTTPPGELQPITVTASTEPETSTVHVVVDEPNGFAVDVTVNGSKWVKA